MKHANRERKCRSCAKGSNQNLILTVQNRKTLFRTSRLNFIETSGVKQAEEGRKTRSKDSHGSK
jgi:hypothetical protein